MNTYTAGDVSNPAVAARVVASGAVLAPLRVTRSLMAGGAVTAASGVLAAFRIGEVVERAKAPAETEYSAPPLLVGQLWPLEIEVDEMIQIYSPVAIGDIIGLQAALEGKAAVGFTGNEVVSYEAATALLQYRAVVINTSGKAIYADSSINAHAAKVLGLTLEEAAGPGEFVDIRNYGQIEEVSWSWAPDMPIYLGDDGQLTQTAPVAGFRLQIAFPISPTRIFVDINDPVYLNGGGSWNYNETPVGTVNGFNNTFTTANVFIAGKTVVFLNGVRQKLGLHYSESGGNQIVFAAAPQPGDILVMDYLAA